MTRTLSVLPLLLVAALAPACGGAALRTPPGFAELGDNDDYDYRATDASGVVIAVRRLPNRPRANLDFWTMAVHERLRRQGYQPDGLQDVRTTAGMTGRQLRYTRVERGVTYRYWVTVFVRDRVYCLEAGGDQTNFDRVRPQIDGAVLAFRD